MIFSHLLTICALLFAPAITNDVGAVRIGLFSLFEPQNLNVRVLAHSGATMSAGNHTDLVINKDETIRIRRAGSQLTITIVDTFNRVKQTVMTRGITVTPAEAPAEVTSFELEIPAKIKRVVRGALAVSAVAGVEAGKTRNVLQIVLTASRESTVASVVGAELGAAQPLEAYKALAVVVRTFMMGHDGRHRDEGFDYCDTTHCQLYRGEDDLLRQPSATTIRRAVSETAGRVLQFDHEIVEGYYTAVCGGVTATPEMVWGGAVKGPYQYNSVACKWCAASVYCDWDRQAEAVAVRAALSAATGLRLSPAAALSVQKYPSSDITQWVIVKDRGREVRVSGDQFRRAIGKRIGWNKVLSPTFVIEQSAGRFIFHGRGFGSQVGLCVAGAVAQAASGRRYDEILGFYFPRAEISR